MTDKQTPLARALERIAALGDEALLDAREAAAALNVSRSTFDRQGYAAYDMGERTKRYRWGSLTQQIHERERAA
jgi:hypothetical protein